MDDALLLGQSKQQILMRLAALSKAIFVVMGKPDMLVRQCPFAMDRWSELIVGPVQKMLGLDINTYRLTVGILMQYVQEVLKLLNNTWYAGRNWKQFIVLEVQKLTGKLGYLAKSATWIFHLISHLYTLIVHALSENKRLLLEFSRGFREIVISLKTGSFNAPCKDQAKHISFAMKWAAKLVHHSKYKYHINKTMWQEIEFFREKLHPSSGIFWETPIAHTRYHKHARVGVYLQ